MKKLVAVVLIVVACATAGWVLGQRGGPAVQSTGLAANAPDAPQPLPELCEGYSGLPAPATGQDAGMVAIQGGEFTMAAGNLYEDEGSPRRVRVASFLIDRHEITNAQFSEFVAATGYVTVAERTPDPSLHPNIDPSLLVAGGIVFDNGEIKDPVMGDGWWLFVPGANWRHPRGPSSSIDKMDNHPVVQITVEDARAYAQWRGRRLPTEAEWEYAARGGLDGKRYAWGNELKPDDQYLANTWQGVFPVTNSADDGFVDFDRVGCYPPNGFGLVDMIGNVWELTDTAYEDKSAAAKAAGNDAAAGNRQVVIKGGSYLCAASYCRRYRPAARQGQEPDLGSTHIGFRTVASCDATTDCSSISNL